MRDKFISNHLAAFHYEANAFQFANVSDRITGNRYQIGEFPGLDRANAVLPAQHFCGIRGDGPYDVERPAFLLDAS